MRELKKVKWGQHWRDVGANYCNQPWSADRKDNNQIYKGLRKYFRILYDSRI